MTRMLLVATVLALLAFSGNLMAVPPPDCPATGLITNSWSNGGVTIQAVTPTSGAICNGACCQTLTVSGLPLNWTLNGYVESNFIFTTQCVGGQPKPPELIQNYPVVNWTSDGSTPFTLKICYPHTESWTSFEIHVDVSLEVKDANGQTAMWVGNDLANAPGKIGPGIGPNGQNNWDPICYNTSCTPGYWKTHCNSGCNNSLVWPGGYLPTDSFNTTFGVSGCGVDGRDLLTVLGPDNSLSSQDKTKQMAFQCTAALLNAAYANNVISAQCGVNGGNCNAFGQATPEQNIIDTVKDACSGQITKAAAQAYCTFYAVDSLCPHEGAWLGTCNGNSECAAINPGVPCNPNSP